MHDIDDLISDDEEETARSAPVVQKPESADLSPASKTQVGEVERFFSKVSVAAIHLEGDLKIGDTIEIDDDSGPMTVEVSSMQIDRKDVESASAGDSIGVKVESPVKKGSKVYLVRSVD